MDALAPRIIECTNCHWSGNSRDLARVVSTSARSIIQMRALVSGMFRTTPCPSCDKQLPFEPGLLHFGIVPPRSYASLGEAYADDPDEFLSGLTAFANTSTPPVRVFDTQGQLLEAVIEDLRGAARAMTPVNKATAEGTELDFIVREWRSLPPDAVVASHTITFVQRLIATGDHSQVRVALESDSRQLARLQALTWIGMCLAWADKPPTDDRFEDLIDFVLPDEAIFGDTPREFLERAMPLLNDDEASPFLSYFLDAVHAVACVRNGQMNVRAAQWTGAFFAVERWHWEATGDDKALLDRFRLSEEQLRDTLDYEMLAARSSSVLNDALQQARSSRDWKSFSRVTGMVEGIGKRGGIPQALFDIANHGVKLNVPSIDTGELAARELADMVAAGVVSATWTDTQPTLASAIPLLSGTLVENRDGHELCVLFDAATTLAGDTETLAELETWLGSTLVKLGREHQVLERIGADEREWEARLTARQKGALWTERANALRAAGRLTETLAWRRRVPNLYESERGSNNHRQALRLLAIALRETGAPDAAIKILEPLLDGAEGMAKLELLDSLSATWVALGEIARARGALEEALALAHGPFADRRPRIASALAALSPSSSAADRERRLLEIPKSSWVSPIALMQECAAWGDLIDDDHALSEEATARFIEGMHQLGEIAANPPPTLQPMHYELVCLTMANLADKLGFDDTRQHWGLAADAADRMGLSPRPIAVLALAAAAYRNGEIKEGRSFLAAMPAAMERDVSTVESVGAALGTMRNLRARFVALTDLLCNANYFTDARIVAELAREPLRRASSARFKDFEIVPFMTARSIGAVVEDGQTAVLEFLEVEDGFIALFTFLRDGRVTLAAPALPDDERLAILPDRLLNRLQVWHAGRSGSPFDAPGWNALRDWLRTALEELLPRGGHLAVIDADVFLGIPWHVAVAPDWTCSYSSSWAAIIQAKAAATASNQTLGFAMVPAASDGEIIVSSMDAARQQCRALGEAQCSAYAEAVGTACDAEALAQLFSTSSIVFCCCHGFVDPASNEAAFVIASRGGLPPATAMLASGAATRPNHFGWRDVEQLDAAPALVFSAACSSGRAYLGGLGERLGLFASLADRGTRTLLAPAWDVEAREVLPIAVRTLELYLAGDTPIVHALNVACTEAARTQPAHVAWALTIEGDWT